MTGSATVDVENSSLDSDGNGLLTAGTASVSDSDISNNSNADVITENGTATISGSTFQGATYGIDQVGGQTAISTTRIDDPGMWGVQVLAGDLTMTDSEIAGNRDDNGLANRGNGAVTVADSTLTDTATGAAVADIGSLTLVADTLVGNGEAVGTQGGTLSIGADILAGSPGGDCIFDQPTDLGYNITDDTTCTLSSGTSVTDSSTLDASLQGLADNGGPTETDALALSSPAAQLVTGALSDGTRVCGTPDQRTELRPAGICDAGAYETQPVLETPDVELAATPGGDATLGATVTLSATVSGEYGAPTGTVSFTEDGDAISSDCTGLALDEMDTASCTTSALPAGTFDLRAHYSGDTTYTRGADDVSPYVVGKGDTTTQVSVQANSLTAAVAAVAPAAGVVPTGTVIFSVDGSPVGSSSLSSGSATLIHVASGAHTVSAVYQGSTQLNPSVGSTATTNPTITAHVTSAHPKTSYGWYRGPVTVSFTCEAGSAALSGSCPASVKLGSNGAGQSVTRKVSDGDGGVASVTVEPINIDTHAPTPKITGFIPGKAYAKRQHARCAATDALSGVATCTLTTASRKHGKTTIVTVTATAIDKAGNSASRTADYDLKKSVKT